MSVTLRQFRNEYPQFRQTDNEVVQGCLTRAHRRVSTRAWGAKADDGIMLLAAHLISMGPSGEQSRLKKENRGTIYGDEYRSMMREVVHGFRVI